MSARAGRPVRRRPDGGVQPVSDQSPEVEVEQAHLDRLYTRLDALVDAAQQRLVAVRATGSTGTPQARSERDAFAQALELRIATLRAVQDRLCFGRLDLRTGERHHIGRIGLSDERQDKLVGEWRGPRAGAPPPAPPPP